MAEYPNITAIPSPLPAGGQNGVIGGGALRPGAIDQTQFQQLLEAQYQAQNQAKAPPPPAGLTLADYRKLAGIQVAAPNPAAGPTAPTPALQPVVSGPAALPAPQLLAPPNDGIPTLSLEQFAALTGLSAPEPTPAPTPASAPGPVPMTSDLVGPTEPLVPSAAETADAAGLADGVPVIPPATESDPAAESQDPDIVLLDRPPDRDERRTLAGQGKTWRLRETPGARELFLGPDGKFGWDDFIDIINPLQHIPVVAQIYRAVTGDQAYALSAFIGAAPFGPLSVASAIIDTVIRDQTGRDAGTDMAARVLGIDNRTPEEADLDLVQHEQDQMAAASSPVMEDDLAPPQVADAGAVQAAAANPTWMRDRIGAGRD